MKAHANRGVLVRLCMCVWVCVRVPFCPHSPMKWATGNRAKEGVCLPRFPSGSVHFHRKWSGILFQPPVSFPIGDSWRSLCYGEIMGNTKKRIHTTTWTCIAQWFGVVLFRASEWRMGCFSFLPMWSRELHRIRGSFWPVSLLRYCVLCFMCLCCSLWYILKEGPVRNEPQARVY